MSKKPKEIRLGEKYLSKGEYSKVIHLLEPKVPIFLENKDFYPILGKAFFYTGDYSGAKLYFERGQKICWEIETSLYLAVLGLKRRDFNSAIRIWLDILDENPNHKMAKKGLTTLKKYSTMDDLENFIHSKKVDRLIPRRFILPSAGTIISIIIIFLLSLSAYGIVKYDGINRFLKWIDGEPKVSLDSNRVGVAEFDLKDFNNNYLEFDGTSVFNFSGKQIEDFFDSASLLFQENRDNMVKTYLNLIKYSNANDTIKNKAKLLESYLVEPGWAEYKDDFTFVDIDRNLYQYEGCLVKWKGKLSNLEIKNGKIHFSLLVGYDNEKVLEGVVRVELNENIKIQENQPIEVLGKVILEDGGFYLDAVTVLQYVVRN